jgi:hypothetical protein
MLRTWIKIVDRLNETSLFEMAFARRDAKEKITNLSPQIFNHLLKLFVLELPQTNNHWIKEIDGCCNQINDVLLKPNNRHPSKQDLYHWMIFESYTHFDENYMERCIMTWTNQEYAGVKMRDIDKEFTLNQVLKIIDLACADMSIGQYKTVRNYL